MLGENNKDYEHEPNLYLGLVHTIFNSIRHFEIWLEVIPLGSQKLRIPNWSAVKQLRLAYHCSENVCLAMSPNCGSSS